MIFFWYLIIGVVLGVIVLVLDSIGIIDVSDDNRDEDRIKSFFLVAIFWPFFAGFLCIFVPAFLIWGFVNILAKSIDRIF